MLQRITLLLILAALPLTAQEKPTPSPTVFRLEYTIVKLEGARKVQSQNYSLLANDQKSSRMRMGFKVPIGGPSGIQYLDVGVNIDAQPMLVEPNLVRLNTKMEVSAVGEKEMEGSGPRSPVIQSFNDQTEATIPLDKPVILTSQDDPTSKMTIQVQVVARVFK